MSRALSLRLADETFQNLESLCSKLDRSKTYILTKAIEQYLAEYSDYNIALERLNDKDDKIISEEELRIGLGI